MKLQFLQCNTSKTKTPSISVSMRQAVKRSLSLITQRPGARLASGLDLSSIKCNKNIQMLRLGSVTSIKKAKILARKMLKLRRCQLLNSTKTERRFLVICWRVLTKRN